METLKYSKAILIILLTVYSCQENKNTAKKLSETDSTNLNIKESHDTLLVDKDPNLMKAWVHFKNTVITNNFDELKRISFDSIKTCTNPYSTSGFIKHCFTEVFDSTLLKRFSDKTYTGYVESEMELDYFSNKILSQLVYQGNSVFIKQFYMTKEFTPDGAWTYVFDFLKTKKGYLFWGVDSYGGPICCH